MQIFDGVMPPLCEALSKRGYSTLTPVQESVLDPSLLNSDLLVSSQTGSGKTVAFGLVMAPTILGEKETFEQSGPPVAIVIAPTRELALQVKMELSWLYKFTKASIVSCVGGMDMRAEQRALRGNAHIVVGTPGRVKDHIERGSLNLENIKGLVLDEADEMLDMGFRDDLEFILETTPVERRTLMFSATVPKPIVSLAKRYQRDAVRISTKGEGKQHADIDYFAYSVTAKNRESAIANVLRYYDAKNALVFCGTRAAVNDMTSRFNSKGFSVVALSGELSQKERTNALQSLRNGNARICIATDVAARGLDLPNLELVVHADIPRSGQILLHRSGRTGRAGRRGVTALMVTKNARRRTEILFQHSKIKAKWLEPPTKEQILSRDNDRIVEHQLFQDDVHQEDLSVVQRILETYSAEKIAAAFVRSCRIGEVIPSDNPTDSADLPSRHKGHVKGDDSKHTFQAGAWFVLSSGRKDGVEARWLLPMLCRVGKLNHGEVGKILINSDQTRVEISKDAESRFLKAIGPDCNLEKGIKISPTNETARGRPNFDGFGGKRRDKKRAERSAKSQVNRHPGRKANIVELSEYKSTDLDKAVANSKKKKLAMKQKKSKSRVAPSNKKPRTTFEKRKRNSSKR
jgi:ATP-dependent RNA helicase DeaD